MEKEGKIDFMKRKADWLKGKSCIFRLKPKDRSSVRNGVITKAVYTGIHKNTGLHTFDVTIQGASGKVVIVDAIDHKLNIKS